MRIGIYRKLEKVVHEVRVEGREREKEREREREHVCNQRTFIWREEHVLPKNIMKRIFFFNLIIVRSNKLHPVLGCWPRHNKE